jgi:hypothetical protein
MAMLAKAVAMMMDNIDKFDNVDVLEPQFPVSGLM